MLSASTEHIINSKWHNSLMVVVKHSVIVIHDWVIGRVLVKLMKFCVGECTLI